MIDALRSYLQVAAGIVEATATKAKESASSLISQGLESGAPEISAQVTEIAEDLLEQSRTNRELLLGLIRTEIDRNIGRMGFVREEELAAVRKHVLRLEQELVMRSGQATELATAAVSTAASAGSAIIDVASIAASAAASSAAAAAKSAQPSVKAPVKTPVAEPAVPAVKKAPAKAPAKKTPVRKPTAKKTAAHKTAQAPAAAASPSSGTSSDR